MKPVSVPETAVCHVPDMRAQPVQISAGMCLCRGCPRHPGGNAAQQVTLEATTDIVMGGHGQPLFAPRITACETTSPNTKPAFLGFEGLVPRWK